MKINKVIYQSNKLIEEYKSQFKKLEDISNNSIIKYLKKSEVEGLLEKMNYSMVELYEKKEEFDFEHKKLKSRKDIGEKIKESLNSYEEYLLAVIEHIVIVKDLQVLYRKNYIEQLKLRGKINSKLEELEDVSIKCEEKGKRFNEHLKLHFG